MSSNPDAPSPAYAWYFVAVLLVAYTLSFIDRMILSLLVGPIRADLGIGRRTARGVRYRISGLE